MRAILPENNRLQGKAFEDLFLKEAQYRGLYARKNHVSAKYGWGGRLIPVKGDLDYVLIDPQTGRVAWVDCKSFVADHFTFSDIETHQLEQSVLLNECRVASGFVVLFGASGSVAFYTGTEIGNAGPQRRFTPEMGLALGSVYDFDLRPILSTSTASRKVRSKKRISLIGDKPHLSPKANN